MRIKEVKGNNKLGLGYNEMFIPMQVLMNKLHVKGVKQKRNNIHDSKIEIKVDIDF